MRLQKKDTLEDRFTCEKFGNDESNLSPIPFRLCLNRQMSRSASSLSPLYPECVDCNTGIKIATHFKDYKKERPVFKPKPLPKKERGRRGWKSCNNMFVRSKVKGSDTAIAGELMRTDEPGCDFCQARIQALMDLKIALKAQVEYLIDLVIDGRTDKIVERLHLVNDELLKLKEGGDATQEVE